MFDEGNFDSPEFIPWKSWWSLRGYWIWIKLFHCSPAQLASENSFDSSNVLNFCFLYIFIFLSTLGMDIDWESLVGFMVRIPRQPWTEPLSPKPCPNQTKLNHLKVGTDTVPDIPDTTQKWYKCVTSPPPPRCLRYFWAASNATPEAPALLINDVLVSLPGNLGTSGTVPGSGASAWAGAQQPNPEHFYRLHLMSPKPAKAYKDFGSGLGLFPCLVYIQVKI